MTENDFEETADWLESRDTIQREIDVDGQSLPIEVQDITQTELDALEDRAQEGLEEEAEVIHEAIEEYLVNPDVSPEDVPMNKRSQLWFAMQLAWSGADDIQAAMSEMELPQGNR